MYHLITNSLKKIFIWEIKDIIKDHPEFNDVLVINKYQDREREKCNIVVKSASASYQRMSLDNFSLTIQSYSSLANLKGQRGDMMEWIRDDLKNIQNLVPPGYYVVRMTSINEFVIEQFLMIRNEKIAIKGFESGNAIVELRHQNINEGSETITDFFGRKFVKDQHYIIDYTTGKVTFLITINSEEIRVSYQYIMPNLGPFEAKPYTMNNTALPGIVLAFGDRLREGDMQVVIVTAEREDSALVKTGRWNMSIDLLVQAQDSDTAERLVDFVGVNLWALKQVPMADRGITITEISFSGEAEEQELDVPDEWNFSNSISMSVLVDWELHVPLVERIQNIFLNPPVDTGFFSDQQLTEAEKQYKESVNYNTFGTIEDNREGRYNDFNEGSRHFSGIVPVTTTKTTVVSPNIIF